MGLLAIVEIVDLAVARPDMVAVLTVEFHLDGKFMRILHDEGDVRGETG